MKKLLAQIVHYTLKPSNLYGLITHIDSVIRHESELHTLRNYREMSNTLIALKTYTLNRKLTPSEFDELTALLENFEHLIVDELMWRKINLSEKHRTPRSS
jgi:hypothetical protein